MITGISSKTNFDWYDLIEECIRDFENKKTHVDTREISERKIANKRILSARYETSISTKHPIDIIDENTICQKQGLERDADLIRHIYPIIIII